MGFIALDYYFKRYNGSWESRTRLGAIAGRIGEVWFIKPQDFYNLSGRAVKAFADYYKIATSDILVICDNFDLEFGLVRYRSSGSAGGNNGLKSVDASLGTSDYARIRVGTGNDPLRQQMGAVDFVLSRFTDSEKAALPEMLEEVLRKIDGFCKEQAA